MTTLQDALTHFNLPDTLASQYQQYFELLIKWQQVFNLTAITSFDEIITHHLLDSLSVLPYVPDNHLLDVGTGAGFPGMVLAIAKPQLQVTLLDSAGKKTRFLQQVKATLKLNNVTVVNARVEDYHPEQLFEGIVSRAFSDLTKFVEVTQHCCLPTGQWLAMKGRYPDEEISSLPDSVSVQTVQELDVPGLDAKRHLVTIVRSEA